MRKVQSTPLINIGKPRVERILVVKVCSINRAAMEYAGLPLMSSSDLIQKTLEDKATWDILAKGYTQGINQCQKDKTTQRLRQYQPRELRDMSSFVAAIRPGFKSQINPFLARSAFSYGVPSFDMILHNDSTKSSWMLYQENTMTALNLAGFELSRTYPIIKAISKKKTKVIAAAKEEFLEGFTKYLMSDSPISESAAKTQSEAVWQVIEDSASYSFNASHAVCVSLDALYGAYLKAHYPYAYYQALLDDCANSGSTGKKKAALIRQEMLDAFGIHSAPCRFRQDNRQFRFIPEEKEAVNALSTVKDVSHNVAEILYQLRERTFDSFVDVLLEFDGIREITKKNITPLIETGYFREFGSAKKLNQVAEAFREGKIKYDKKHTDATKGKRLAALRAYEKSLPDEEYTCREINQRELEYYGSPMTIDKTHRGEYMLIDFTETKTHYVCQMFNMGRGSTGKMKIFKKMFNALPITPGDVIELTDWDWAPVYSYEKGKRVKTSLKEVVVKGYKVL